MNKFNIDEEVWFCYNGAARSSPVTSISKNPSGVVFYNTKLSAGDPLRESVVFRTREALVQNMVFDLQRPINETSPWQDAPSFFMVEVERNKMFGAMHVFLTEEAAVAAKLKESPEITVAVYERRFGLQTEASPMQRLYITNEKQPAP
jgi:hypothetical protein